MSKITKNQKIRKIVGIAIAIPMIGAITGATIWGNDLAFNDFANNLTEFFNTSSSTNSDSVVAARAKGNELSREIVREGTVLLKNDNDTLPLSKSITKVNVFGHNSVDWYICGSGSGAIHDSGGEPQYNICTALERNGVTYNKELYNFYYAYRAPLGGNNPSTLSNTTETCSVLAEPDLTASIKSSAEAFSDVAIVSIGRKAGETEDLPRVQYKFNKNADTSRTYLQISTEEEELLRYCGETFDKVIVVINSTNAMELGFLDTIPGIDACLYSGVTGNFGANGLYDIMFGDYSPSGHLSSTLAREMKYNIVYYYGAYEMTGQYQNASSSAWPYNRNYKRGQEKTVFYSDYVEGIYVGYKWFETADAEGYWDSYGGYNNVVQFPFGYGMSYTTFDWELDDISIPNGGKITDNKEVITAKVKVTNTGDFAGKDVVQVYLTAPYTPGGIEKSYVNLVGYGKTQTLNPGESTFVNINLRVSDFESYDCYDKNNNGHTGYELDAGEYQIKFMTDSHTLKAGMTDNIITYTIDSTINVDEDEVTGNKVGNLFTGEDAIDGFASDGSNANQNVAYISRANFPALPTKLADHRGWNAAFEVSKNAKCNNTYDTTIADAWDNKTGLDEFGNQIPTTKPTWGSDKGLDVISGGALTEIGKKLADPANWDSADWDTLLDQVSWNEAIAVINTDALGTSKGVPSVNRPDGSDADGPQQIGKVAALGGNVGTGYPGGPVIAQCWSQSISYAMGKSYGGDMQSVQRTGAYAFGCNIQRTPFCGRNFEYYSEDAFLSAQCAANASRGVAVNGKYCFLKHFAVNNQEFHRVGLYTWLSEQALREIYLKPFKEAVLYGELTAIMTSFNRIGATWTGGSTALLTGVLRGEWGFKGFIITDYCESWELMDQAMAVRAGSNYGMKMTYTYGDFDSVPTQNGSTARFQNRLRNCVKEVIYGYIRPMLVNANYNESADNEEYIISTAGKKPWEYWRPLIITLDAVIFGALIYWAYIAFRPIPDAKVTTTNEPSVNEPKNKKGGSKNE